MSSGICTENEENDVRTLDEKSWPTSINCEMDIDEWEKALDGAGVLEEYEDVIRGFKEGFDQGIPNHFFVNSKWYTPPNHISSILAEDKIKRSMEKELLLGRIFGPFTHQEVYKKVGFFRTNPMGAVVNCDGSIRPINDLSYPRNNADIPSLNSFVDANDFKTTWDDFATVSQFFRKSEQPLMLAIFDWEKAYRQIPKKIEQQHYMLILGPDGLIYYDTRIGFGGVAGCGSFGRPADAWKMIMKHEFNVVEVFRWVDDALFIKELTSQVTMNSIVERSLQMGVITNKDKISDFKPEQKFIGFLWNGVEKTVHLPPQKLKERRDQIEESLTIGKKFSFNEVEVLVGRLNHVSLILPQMRCCLTSLYRWLKSWKHHFATQKLPEDAEKDLEEWKWILSIFETTRLIKFSDPIDIVWMGDASTSYGVGVVIGKKEWFQMKLRTGWEDSGMYKRGIAWLETVAIRIALWHIVSTRNYDGKSIIVWTDNTTSEKAILNRKSRDIEVNEEWKKIQRILIDSQMDLVAKRVISKENVVDDISRGESNHGKPEKYRVLATIPLDLVDCFSQIHKEDDGRRVLSNQFPGLIDF